MTDEAMAGDGLRGQVAEPSPEPAAHDRASAVGRFDYILPVLLGALLLAGAAAAIVLASRLRTEPYLLVLTSAVASVGLGLFTLARGMVRLRDPSASHSLMQSVLDGAFDAIVVTDQAGRVIYANAAYLALIGASELQDARPVERVFIGDADASEAIYRLLKAAREGSRLQEEVWIGAAPGRPARSLRMKIRPLGGAGRAARLTVWSVSDVTHERQRQEDAFQELQHALDYLDHAPAGFFSADPAGEIVFLNTTLAGWLDQDPAPAFRRGLKLADLVAGDGAALLTTLRAAPGEVKTELLDLDLKMRSGRTLPVRLFHKVAFGADGRPGASRTLVLNRGRAAGADPQRAAEVRFMRFFHHTPMAIATIDRDGGIVRTNALFARLLPGGAKDRSIRAIVAPRDWAAVETAIGQAAQGKGDIAPVDAMLAGEDERYGRFYVTAVGEGERDPEAAIVYALETTEQRALESRLIQQQKMESIGQLAGGMAHDFNNMLNAIILANDFLLNTHKPTDPSYNDIIEIRQSANRAASLVRHLLAFSRKQTLRPQVLDLGEVLSDLTVVLRRLLGEKITLNVVHGRDLWPVKADLLQLEQVITNLAINAHDAMPNGGQLELRSSNVTAPDSMRYNAKGMPAADYVLIEVADSGGGIPEAIRDKIFVPFFTTKEVGKGTGLGLSTVYGIVKQTGGFVYFDSVEGVGTTFRIFLPRHAARTGDGPVAAAEAAFVAAMPGAADKAPHAAGADLTGEGTILLVEDEEGLRALNARGLASRGYTVLQAGNGIEAIAALEKSAGEVSLVVSDVVMPEMDGPSLLRELRRRSPDLKVIFVSGYAEDAFQKHLPADGKFDFLAKPFTLKQLVEKVKQTMAS